jgi:hypothetical protein
MHADITKIGPKTRLEERARRRREGMTDTGYHVDMRSRVNSRLARGARLGRPTAT